MAHGGTMRASFLGATVVAAAAMFAPESARAQQVTAESVRQQIDQLRLELQTRINALEAQLQMLQGQPASAPVAPVAPVAPDAPGSSKIFNPDMAVIGDFLGAAGRNTVNPSPALEMHESEASFQAIVDPYARADFFISFGEE